MRDWQGKRYWVVGASEGLGREVSFELSKRGVELVVSARNIDRLNALADELPAEMAAIPLNPGVIDTAMLQSCFGSSAASYPSPTQWAESRCRSPGDRDRSRSTSLQRTADQDTHSKTLSAYR